MDEVRVPCNGKRVQQAAGGIFRKVGGKVFNRITGNQNADSLKKSTRRHAGVQFQWNSQGKEAEAG